MTIETDLRTKVLADSAVSSRVGTRMYPGEAPQGVAYPFLTYQVISAQSTQHLGGKSNMHDPLIQIDAWALTAVETWQLANEVRAAIEAFRGTMGSFWVQRIFLDNWQDMPPEPGVKADERVYRRTQDFIVVHTAT